VGSYLRHESPHFIQNCAAFLRHRLLEAKTELGAAQHHVKPQLRLNAIRADLECLVEVVERTKNEFTSRFSALLGSYISKWTDCTIAPSTIAELPLFVLDNVENDIALWLRDFLPWKPSIVCSDVEKIYQRAQALAKFLKYDLKLQFSLPTDLDVTPTISELGHKPTMSLRQVVVDLKTYGTSHPLTVAATAIKSLVTWSLNPLKETVGKVAHELSEVLSSYIP